MYYDELIQTMHADRVEASARRAVVRSARAAPGRRPVREAIGRMLVRTGSRLLPDERTPAPASGPPC